MNTPADDAAAAERRLDLLFAAVRADKPETSRAEYGFETRLMATLAARPSRPALWTRWTWQLAPFFAVITLSLTLWSQFAPGPAATDDPARMVQEWAAPADDDLGGLVFDDFLASS